MIGGAADTGGGRPPILEDGGERLLAAVLDSLDDAVLVVGPPRRGIVRVCNGGATRIFGWAPDELVGGTTERLHVDREAFERFGELSRKGLEAAGRFATAWTMRRRGGSLFEAEITVSVLDPARGWQGGVVSVVRDVSQRVRAEREGRAAEEALRRSESRLRSIFEHAGLGLALVGLEGRILDPNPAMCRITGRPRERLVGASWRELTPEEDMVLEAPLVEELLSGRRDHYTIQKRYLRPDGDTVPVRVTVSLLRGPAGEPQSVLGIVEDVTPLVEAAEERERLLAEVRALARMLEETEQAERRSVARELHDSVGQSVAALSLNLAMIRRDLASETTPRIAALLDDSLETLQHVGARVRDVMAELRPPMLDDFGVVATLRWLADRLRTRTGMTIAVRGLEPDPRLGDPAEMALVRVAQEALSNVARHASASRVTITLHARDDLVRLTVTDDGVGFDPGEHRRADGAGWGIVGMRERMEAIGGTVRVDSAPGRGTRVVAEVPR